ncbi:hypothetical protein DFH09DRAFT_1492835 [Mycena vulgaris]|nr:hypothetical protein DFH09DRAFT_1492835 [Mycena vulgaris]
MWSRRRATSPLTTRSVVLTGDVPADDIPIALLLSCRQVNLEVLRIMHQRNTFHFHAKELNTMVLGRTGPVLPPGHLHSDYCGIGHTRHWLDSVPSWLDAIPLLPHESLVFMFEFGWVDGRRLGGGASMWSASGTCTVSRYSSRMKTRWRRWTDLAQTLRDVMIGPGADDRYRILLEEKEEQMRVMGVTHFAEMSTISPPPLRCSKPAKTRSPKRSAAAKAPAAPVFDEDIDLRKLALKRCSLEWAVEALSTTILELTATTETTPAPPASSAPALSEPPRRRSSLKKIPRPSFQRTMTETTTSTLATLELPEDDATRAIARASSESTLELACSRRCFNSRARRSSNGSLNSTTSTDSSSSARSRSASLSSVSSTESESETSCSKRVSLRAIPPLCLSTIVGLCIEFKTAMIPGPTPEDLLTIPPIPLMRMRDKPRRRPHPAFQSLTPGEKRIRFLCPRREYRDPLWPDYEETLPEEE